MAGEQRTDHKNGEALITKEAAELLPKVNGDLNSEDYISRRKIRDINIKFIEKFLMKTIKTIVKFEGAADRYTDRINDNGLMSFLSRINADNGFVVYKVRFCFEGFRVHNNTPKYFWFG